MSADIYADRPPSGSDEELFWLRGYQAGVRQETENAKRRLPDIDHVAAVGEPNLHNALEDAIWQALDSEQAMPHSGVDPTYVIAEFLRRLRAAGYSVLPTPDVDSMGEEPTP